MEIEGRDAQGHYPMQSRRRHGSTPRQSPGDVQFALIERRGAQRVVIGVPRGLVEGATYPRPSPGPVVAFAAVRKENVVARVAQHGEPREGVGGAVFAQMVRRLADPGPTPRLSGGLVHGTTQRQRVFEHIAPDDAVPSGGR